MTGSAIASRVLIKELPSHEGQQVKLRGFVYTRRDLGGVQFLLLRDRSGVAQVVLSKTHLPMPESSVEVIGKVVRQAKAPGGFEVQASNLHVLSEATEPPPVEMNKVEWHANPETLLDYRYVTVRGLKDRAALKVQATLVDAFRDYLSREGFTEIFTPKIVSAGAEGGANLFELDYFGERAYLAQSPQLYKQIMVGVFERVFETAPVYRAEEHATSRHLNEYLSLDVELGFIDSEEDVMDVEEALLRNVVERLEAQCQEEFDLFGASLPILGERFPRIPLMEARRIVTEKYGHQVGGKDLDPEAERLFSQYVLEEYGSDFVFVTKYPRTARPFYAFFEEDGFTRSFDLLFRGIEITSGGQRIHDLAMLKRSLSERGMSEAGFEGYLEVFKHGMPPHGGFAIGAERLTAKLLGIANVRFARAFPRDRHRLTP
ncbi:aspartate--tRNA(Asn) ligase [Deinococcus yavapaiensis]|uniref:Aspartate--tRNA(Asp/Asn) ligase n=1 Tax=Deinococcus yavapaiensis KR-236 TaxID=694435 RepID=A0A318SGB6_9DEIO|nr:aspartate--tRNA(Asn) ligase [Deinococcus yavapaiensis]PYE53101.1 aspartate--tRNA(Asn) ligase [Deinococcus yavapaiensis KR-236]